MSLSKKWVLHIEPRVYRTLKRLPRRDAEAVLEVISLLPEDPYFGDIQKMKGFDNTWRRRIGEYRLFYRIKIVERIILVFNLERRTSSTY